MKHFLILILGLGGMVACKLGIDAFTEAFPNEKVTQVSVTPEPSEEVGNAQVSPYRTFITLEEFRMEQNGEPHAPISNVRLRIAFPHNNQFELPEGGEYWPIGDGQVQEINRHYELPWDMVNKDGFNFHITIVRKGNEYLPCKFAVSQLSQFNRAYICHTDKTWQEERGIPQHRQDLEGIKVRVYTDRISPKNEIPESAILLKRLPPEVAAKEDKKAGLIAE